MIPPVDINPNAIRIGVDPDVDKSGFAVYDPSVDKFPELYSYDLIDLFEELKKFSKKKVEIVVILEAGWLISSTNFNGGGLRGAQHVGRNHQVGREIEKACIKFGIKYVLRRPRGYSSYKHTTYCALTKHKGKRTNEDTRVAGLFAFFG